MNEVIRLGTRGSALARWQTNYVQQLLQDAWPQVTFETEVITTQGDLVVETPLPKIGGKGLFTLELEEALRSGAIDLAVHSLKDLPTELSDGLAIGATPRRADPADVLVSRGGNTLETLPQGAAVGSCSGRRTAQLLRIRPDLRVLDIRGNVDTRIRKALDPDGPYDAIVLARAGLKRLERIDVISQVFSYEQMLPAPGQGALAVQCRNDARSFELLAPINDAETEAAVTAERAFLAGLGGGCSIPVAAYATITSEQLHLRGRVCSPDGRARVEVEVVASIVDSRGISIPAAYRIGIEMAQKALEQGAAALLEAV